MVENETICSVLVRELEFQLEVSVFSAFVPVELISALDVPSGSEGVLSPSLRHGGAFCVSM